MKHKVITNNQCSENIQFPARRPATDLLCNERGFHSAVYYANRTVWSVYRQSSNRTIQYAHMTLSQGLQRPLEQTPLPK